MTEFTANLIVFMNQNPIFKGLSVIIAGLVGLLFWLYMKDRWKEPESFGFKVFLYFTIFVILYGAWILIVRPGWWKLPY